jgi:hypothetical protein
VQNTIGTGARNVRNDPKVYGIAVYNAKKIVNNGIFLVVLRKNTKFAP